MTQKKVQKTQIETYTKSDVGLANVDNAWRPFATNLYTDGAALVGHKIWVKNLPGSTDVKWLYTLQNTGTVLHRVLII